MNRQPSDYKSSDGVGTGTDLTCNPFKLERKTKKKKKNVLILNLHSKGQWA